MIAHLRGSVLQKLEKSLILDIQGVGYSIKANTNLLSEIKENEEISLFIHTHVREDDISLYGFQTSEELTLFKLVISVSGIGPKIGLELLNQPVGMIQNAIYESDTAFLSSTPGLGKKTAEKIILDLKNKVSPTTLKGAKDSSQPLKSEVIEALENLGYNRQQINLGLKKIDSSLSSTEEIITAFLKEAYQK